GIGTTSPGTPGWVPGHTRSIASAITSAVADAQDRYIEELSPQNHRQYEYQGKWEEAQVIREEIKVKGARTPLIEEVYITRHGPILTSLSSSNKDNQAGKNGTGAASAELPLALRWTGLEQCNVI